MKVVEGNPRDSRWIAWTRQMTGDPYGYRAYVTDRTTGKVAQGCMHRHRSTRTAENCAVKMRKGREK